MSPQSQASSLATDHVLPCRSRVHYLLAKIRDALLEAAGPDMQSVLTRAKSSHPPSTPSLGPLPIVNLLIPIIDPTSSWTHGRYETSASTAQFAMTNYIFYGVSSYLAPLTPAMHVIARSASHMVVPEVETASSFMLSTLDLEIDRPARATASRLFAAFSKSVHIWYPILDDLSLHKLLLCSYDGQRFDRRFDHEKEMYYLVLAIGSQLTKKVESCAGLTSATYFEKATSRLDTTCEHSLSDNLWLLQRTLLICLYLLLAPSAGDVWRNLGFAIRLYFDLSHRPNEASDGDKVENTLRVLARTLYCLEW